MLDVLKRIFATEASPRTLPDRGRLALAALLHHVVAIDGVVTEAEEKRLRDLLVNRYGLSEGDTSDLIERGRQAESEAVDLYRFTSTLKAEFEVEERKQIVGLLWDVVYADGANHEFEDNVLWRISELLGVPARDRVELRRQAAGRKPPGDATQ